MKKIYWLIIGFLFTIIDFPIYTALRFPIAHIEDEGIVRSVCVEVIRQLLGNHFYIDILPDIIGYVIIAVTAWKLIKFHKRFNHIMYSGIAAAICSVAIMVLPFMPLELKTMVGVLFALKAIDYFCIILIVFSLAKAVYAQVDGYMYLEMWNDFKMDWNIMAVTPPFIYILGLVGIIAVPVVSELAMIMYGLWLYAGLHFIYYVFDYTKKLNLFSDEDTTNALKSN